jgi:hypothetical protein
VAPGDAGVAMEIMQLDDELMPSYAHVLLSGTPDGVLATAAAWKASMPPDAEPRDWMRPEAGMRSVTSHGTFIKGFREDEPTARLLLNAVAGTMLGSATWRIDLYPRPAGRSARRRR